MTDWKKKLSGIRNVVTKSSGSKAAGSPNSDNLLRQLTDKAETLKKEYAKIRRKLRLEDRNEPYLQSRSLIKELEAEQKRLFKQLAEVGEQLCKLSPSTRNSVRIISAKSYERERAKLISERLLNRNPNKKKNLVTYSGAENIANKPTQLLAEVNENNKVSIKLRKQQQEVEMLVNTYGIKLCSDCIDGVIKVICPKCYGTGKLLPQMATKEVKVRCLDTSFGCKLCGGMGEYYKEIETYSQPFCDCKAGYVGTESCESCETCSGLGVIATRSPKNKLSVATFMARLAYTTNADRLCAIRRYLKDDRINAN